jgi:cell wall-associated NlpC family hydrolase
MKKYGFVFIFCVTIGLFVGAKQPTPKEFQLQKMIVTSSVVELLQQPGVAVDQAITATGPTDLVNRSSQIFFGEPVVAHKKEGDWIYVKAPQQEVFTAEQGWTCASGWIRARQAYPVKEFPNYNVSVKSTWATIYKKPDETSEKWIKVCAATKLKGYGRSQDKKWILLRLPYAQIGAIKAEDVCVIKMNREVKQKAKQKSKEELPKSENKVASLRQNIVKTAMHFIGTPYALGGCCATPPGKTKKRTGIDCSGLIKVAYNANGLEVPRTSHAQFLKSNKISSDILKKLKPADLIFSASQKNPQRISHVMMYMGNGQLIESTSGFGKVRVIPFNRRLGKSLETVKYGDKLRHSVYYFGSLLDKHGFDLTATGSSVQFADHEGSSSKEASRHRMQKVKHKKRRNAKKVLHKVQINKKKKNMLQVRNAKKKTKRFAQIQKNKKTKRV